MKKKNLHIAIAIVMLFYCVESFAQITTTTILYDNTSGLSTTKCNVFDPPVNVGGKLHTGVIGGATYTDANGLTLPTQYIVATDKTLRTAYKISYSFKLNYTYSIEITASGDITAGTSYPTIGGGFFTTPGLTNTSTSCNAGDIANFPQQVAFLITVANTVKVYTAINNVVATANLDYLLLEAYILNSTFQNVNANVYIKKIIIKETPPVSFTIPATTTIPCGSTTAETFTISNVYSTTGITNYTWNLGTTPNNWLYNNVAAPASISGSTLSSISLTPVCGSTPKNVSATVTANGTNYNTNTSTVSITQPTMSISGSNTICTSGGYLITGLPSCNASVTWSASPTGIITPNTSTSATPTFTKVAPGNVTLSATVTACGAAQPVLTKAIYVGGYSSGDYPVSGPSSSCKNSTVFFSTVSLPGATSYVWFWPGGWTYNSGQGTTSLSLRTNTESGIVGVRVANACDAGGSPGTRFVNVITSCGSSFSVSPNPATDVLTVEQTDISTNKLSTQSNIRIIEIADKMGVVRYRKEFGKTAPAPDRITIPVRQLKNDVYTIRVFDGKEWQSKKILIQH